MKKITFVTGNQKKLEQMRTLLPQVVGKAIDLPEIQSLDMRDIVVHKMREALALCEPPLLVEDTAFYLDCLQSRDGTPGLPGPLVKWFLHSIGNQGLFELARNAGNVRAIAHTIVAYAPNQNEIHLFEGSLAGSVVAPQTTGFGWDCILKPDGYDVVLDALSFEQRVAINHRAQAVKKLKDFLENE